MRVKILQAFAEGFTTYAPGMEFDTHPARGAELVRRGVAERVDHEKAEAVLAAPEPIPPRAEKRGQSHRKETTR
jgi:hypothetical protein